MKLSWKNISLSYKIFGVLLVTVLVFAGTIILYIIPTLEKKVVEERKDTLKNIVSIALGYCDSIYEDYEKGILDREEMEKRIQTRIRNMRYGPENKDYLWINDLAPKMIMHPFNTNLEGKNLDDYADPTGKKLFVEMADICRRQGSGFVDYQWPKPGSDSPQPKISFVAGYAPWGWVVGSGIYIDDVQSAAWADARTAIIAGALVIAIMDPYGNDAALAAMASAGVTGFAMELMPRITRAQVMDILSSQANLAGYQAVIDAAAQFERAMPMMMTAAGTVRPAKVFVMGAGVAGLQAIATAKAAHMPSFILLGESSPSWVARGGPSRSEVSAPRSKSKTSFAKLAPTWSARAPSSASSMASRRVETINEWTPPCAMSADGMSRSTCITTLCMPVKHPP